MKKLIVFVTFLIAMNAVVNAQKQGVFFVSVDQGLSLPQGKFAEKGITFSSAAEQEVNGLAKPGYQFSLSGGYKFTSHFGVMIQAGYSINMQDKNSYIESARKSYGNDYIIEAKTQPWGIWKVLGGIVIDAPSGINDKLFLQGKLLAGIAKTKEPGSEVRGVKNDMSPTGGAFEFKKAKTDLPASFCWQINAGVGYSITKQLYLLADINYFDSKPVYEFTSQFPGQPPGNGKFKYRLSSVGVNIAVGIRF